MSYIDATQPLPFTVSSIVADLRDLGVAPGSTLLVHSSLSSLGYVAGGAHAVVLALVEVLGPDGTLVVPTQSGDLSDPAQWVNPPVPEAWWPAIRESMPAYDPLLTPTRGMGAIPEVVRHLPGALRSAHPAMSFCAAGRQARTITADHGLEDGLDDASPLARLYDLGADILLLGVGHASNTSLHLAEFRSKTRPRATQGAPMLVAGRRSVGRVLGDRRRHLGLRVRRSGRYRGRTRARGDRGPGSSPDARGTAAGGLRHRVVRGASGPGDRCRRRCRWSGGLTGRSDWSTGSALPRTPSGCRIAAGAVVIMIIIINYSLEPN